MVVEYPTPSSSCQAITQCSAPLAQCAEYIEEVPPPQTR